MHSISALRDAISTVLDYNWDDEAEDYAENPSTSHIFVTLVKLNNWVYGVSETPASVCRGLGLRISK